MYEINGDKTILFLSNHALKRKTLHHALSKKYKCYALIVSLKDTMKAYFC